MMCRTCQHSVQGPSWEFVHKNTCMKVGENDYSEQIKGFNNLRADIDRSRMLLGLGLKIQTKEVYASIALWCFGLGGRRLICGLCGDFCAQCCAHWRNGWNCWCGAVPFIKGNLIIGSHRWSSAGCQRPLLLGDLRHFLELTQLLPGLVREKRH